jgi:hypothetical protein
VREELDRDVGDAEQRARTQAEQQSLGTMQHATVRRDSQQRGGHGDYRGLDGDLRRQR